MLSELPASGHLSAPDNGQLANSGNSNTKIQMNYRTVGGAGYGRGARQLMKINGDNTLPVCIEFDDDT